MIGYQHSEMDTEALEEISMEERRRAAKSTIYSLVWGPNAPPSLLIERTWILAHQAIFLTYEIKTTPMAWSYC